MNAVTFLVFARCAGFVSRAPGISHPSVPRMLRAGVALALTLAIVPGLHASAQPHDALLVFGIAAEVLLGAAMGVGASLLYDGAYAGGRMIDDYVGVKAIAPNADVVAPSGFGRIWSIAFTGAFFLFGAYRVVLLAFADSFSRVPPGTPIDAHAWGTFAASLATTIVLVAIAVAGPSIALAFVVQVALGALSRTIPRFATFTLSFPLVFGAALVATALALPLFVMRAAHPLLIAPLGAP